MPLSEITTGGRSPATRGRSRPVLLVDEPVPAAMQRMTLGLFDQIDVQLANLDSDPDKRIHTARKSMKRIRGLLRLVRDEVGHPAYRCENVVLRDASRKLAPARDGFVLAERLGDLRREYRSILRRNAFAVTSDYLAARHQSTLATLLADRQLVADLRVTLKAARSRFVRWDREGPPPPGRPLAARGVRDEFDALGPGLRRVYTRGRRGMKAAYRDGSEEAFHEWRKRIKYLRYQMEAMAPLWPELLGAHAARLDELGELLGVEHDYAVLGTIARDHDDATADQRERTMLLALVHRSRLELQYQARPLGWSLYSEAPDDFVARMGSYWRAARGW